MAGVRDVQHNVKEAVSEMMNKLEDAILEVSREIRRDDFPTCIEKYKTVTIDFHESLLRAQREMVTLLTATRS